MDDLLFTPDGQLREQLTDTPTRVIARILDGDDGTAPRLLCAGGEYRIVALAQQGGAVELRDGEDRSRGGFQPFRLRRGGWLRVGDLTASLYGRPWSHEGWVFSTSDGQKVAATVASLVEGRKDQDAWAGHAGANQPAAFVVLLEAAGTSLPAPAQLAEALPLPAEALALGCWLIAHWHRAPAGHHVLAAGGDR